MSKNTSKTSGPDTESDVTWAVHILKATYPSGFTIREGNGTLPIEGDYGGAKILAVATNGQTTVQICYDPIWNVYVEHTYRTQDGVIIGFSFHEIDRRLWE
jgi:hypothetical protein